MLSYFYLFFANNETSEQGKIEQSEARHLFSKTKMYLADNKDVIYTFQYIYVWPSKTYMFHRLKVQLWHCQTYMFCFSKIDVWFSKDGKKKNRTILNPDRSLARKGFLKRLDVMPFFVFAPYFGSFRLFFQLFSSLNIFKNNQK